MQYYGIDWLATICGLTGVYLLGSKNRLGFVTLGVASISWFIVGIMVGSWALMLGSVIFFSLHVRGYSRWSRGIF